MTNDSPHKPTVEELRADPVAFLEFVQPGALRPYQAAAVRRLADMIKDGTVYFASTGKTADPPGRLPTRPYSFRGTPCSLHQLRVLLADACQFDGPMPRVLMDDVGIYLKDDERGRTVKFTRAISPDGVSVVNPEWIEL